MCFLLRVSRFLFFLSFMKILIFNRFLRCFVEGRFWKAERSCINFLRVFTFFCIPQIKHKRSKNGTKMWSILETISGGSEGWFGDPIGRVSGGEIEEKSPGAVPNST